MMHTNLIRAIINIVNNPVIKLKMNESRKDSIHAKNLTLKILYRFSYHIEKIYISNSTKKK